MSEPSLTTIKSLFALSDNTCAFPGCTFPIVSKSGTITGEICHIKAKNPGGPRYDANQTDEERHAASNLILLCANHHDIIDKEHDIYTVEIVHEMKTAHENKGRKELLPNDAIFARILLNDYKRVNIANNQGNIIIDSPGAIQASTVNIKTQKKSVQILPPAGTISSDLRMRAYIDHLIRRYNEFASSDFTRKTKFNHGAIRKNIETEFRVNWDLMPVERFDELTQYLQWRINRTRIAKLNKSKGRKNYSTFAEFCVEMLRGAAHKRRPV